MFQELTTDTLEEFVQSNENVLVQFSATWCGNCRVMKPKFKRLAGEHESVSFLVVDAESNPLSRQLANVDNLPTFAAFNNGKLVKQVQTNKAESLKEFVDEVTTN